MGLRSWAVKVINRYSRNRGSIYLPLWYDLAHTNRIKTNTRGRKSPCQSHAELAKFLCEKLERNDLKVQHKSINESMIKRNKWINRQFYCTFLDSKPYLILRIKPNENARIWMIEGDVHTPMIVISLFIALDFIRSRFILKCGK